MTAVRTALQYIGRYRSSIVQFWYPHPREIVRNWCPKEKRRVLEYMGSAIVIQGYLLTIPMRFGPDRKEILVPYTIWSDGLFVWHQSLLLHIIWDNVDLPEQFLHKALHESPARFTPDSQSLSWETDSWIRWSAKRRPWSFRRELTRLMWRPNQQPRP